MKHSFPAALMAVAVLSGNLAYSRAESPSGFNEDTRQYTIVEGDTLWDLSGVFYQNPWFWPRIWYANPPIENPHMIYPGQVISLPEVLAGTAPVPVVQTTSQEPVIAPESVSASVAVVVEEPVQSPEVQPIADAVVEEEMPYQEPLIEEEIPFKTMADEAAESRLDIGALKKSKIFTPTRIIRQTGNEEFLVGKQDLKGDARLLRADRRGTMFSEGDRFWINRGEGEIKKGDKYIIARKQREIYSERTKKSLGYLMHPTGVLLVERVGEEASLGIVLQSFDAIEVSDVLFEPEDLSLEIAAAPADLEINGQIVAMPEDTVIASAWQRVFIDVGDDQGVKRGDILTLFRTRGSVEDSARGRDIDLPNKVIGSLVVVSTGPNGSTGLILDSRDAVRITDRVATPGL